MSGSDEHFGDLRTSQRFTTARGGAGRQGIGVNRRAEPRKSRADFDGAVEALLALRREQLAQAGG